MSKAAPNTVFRRIDAFIARFATLLTILFSYDFKHLWRTIACRKRNSIASAFRANFGISVTSSALPKFTSFTILSLNFSITLNA